MSGFDKRKVVLAVSDVSKHGGIQRFNRILVKTLLALGCDVSLVCLTSSETPEYIRSLKGEFDDLKFYGCNGNKFKFVFTCFFRCVLDRPDVAICGHLNQVVPLSVIFFLTNIDARLLMLHGIEVWGRVGIVKAKVCNLFVKILSVSSYTRDSFLSQAPNVTEEKCLIFPNTVENEMMSDVVTKSTRLNSKKTILSVTRLDKTERDKGIIDVLYALKELNRNDIEYLVVGDGDDKDYLENLADTLDLEHSVKFLGRLTDDELHEVYRSSDVFILPSKKEGFGIVYLEAMLYKKPVIGAAEKGVLDVISDDHNGFKVRYGDRNEIAQCIDRLISDASLCERLGRRGYQDVTDNGVFSYGAYKKRVSEMVLN